MAGNYPNIPGVRMAYDVDGSQGFTGSSGGLTALTQPQLAGLNSESAPGEFDPAVSGGLTGLYFPELRDIAGFFAFVNVGSGGSSAVQTSVDTTTMIDGTWVNLAASWGQTSLKPTYRDSLVPATALGVKAIRFVRGGGGTFGIKTMHVYGSISSGANPNRIRFWHPTIDQALSVTPAFLDWGSAVRNTNSTRQFRIKNNSATLTANSIVISTEILTDASPTMVGQWQYSFGGSAFANTVNIGNLAPGAISGLIDIKRTTPSTAALSVWTARVAAVPGSMT